MEQLARQEKILPKEVYHRQEEPCLTKDDHGDSKHIMVVPVCPDCDSRMIPEGGCMVCYTCGYSKCG